MYGFVHLVILLIFTDRCVRPQRTFLRQFGQHFDITSTDLPLSTKSHTNSASTFQFAPVRFFLNNCTELVLLGALHNVDIA